MIDLWNKSTLKEQLKHSPVNLHSYEVLCHAEINGTMQAQTECRFATIVHDEDAVDYHRHSFIGYMD